MTLNFNNKEGYKNAQGTGLSFEGLANISEAEFIPVSLDSASRDVGNPDSSVHLRPYLALGYDTSSGRYKPFDNTVHASATMVVLAQEVRDMDTVGTNTTAVAIFAGTFKAGIIIQPTTVTMSSVQRIQVRDNV